MARPKRPNAASRPSGLASKKPTSRKPSSGNTLKYGQLSRKQKETLHEYGELVPKDFEDEEDLVHGTEGTSHRRKIVTEPELERQASLKRHAEQQATQFDEDEDDEGEDEWQQPSAYNKLVGLLQKGSKNKDLYKKRRLEEEGMEDAEEGSGLDEGDEENEVEEDAEEDAEEVVELTNAQIRMLTKKFGEHFIDRLEAGEVDPDELKAALEGDGITKKKSPAGKSKVGEWESRDVSEAGNEEMDEESDDEGDGEDEKEYSEDANDDFIAHFGDHNSEKLNARVSLVEQKGWTAATFQDSVLEQVTLQTVETTSMPSAIDVSLEDGKGLAAFNVKHRLQERWPYFNAVCLEEAKGKPLADSFTPLQYRLFQHINRYRDVLYCDRTHLNAREIRHVYALHTLNHVMKFSYLLHIPRTRDRILKNNQKITKMHSEVNDIGEIRDQGFTRPKVLILLPFRNAVVDVVKSLILLSGSEQQEHRKRFFDEYDVPEPDKEDDLAYSDKPADHVAAFRGNVDDHFRLGIKFTRKTMKLYSDFYSADVLIASSLGLRMIIGAEGDKKQDFDYLSSIEVVIIDQTQMFLMQNWDHIEVRGVFFLFPAWHIFEHMNRIPKDAHGCDFSRVKNWYLDNRWVFFAAKFYSNAVFYLLNMYKHTVARTHCRAKHLRQTLIFSDFLTPEINALFNKHCKNVGGRLKIRLAAYKGSIVDVVPQVQQIFTRIETPSLAEEADVRFKYFVEKVFWYPFLFGFGTLPTLRKSAITQSHTLIFIPSYFDFVRLRNYLDDGQYSFTQICEYTTTADVSRARSNFFHGRMNFLLYTERFHFFRRYNIRGAHHMVFYALPDHPRFYAEIVNFLTLRGTGVSAAEESTFSCSALFSKYDVLKLERIVGTERARKMCAGGRNMFMFT
ncbi:hypothetical protein BC936DRAFT_149979 [Jimgerdemannia flammicorona]|uniref:U3 small nucleolar RNA-associated protein 25 n=1 Tax=Jimgerdemannia flammicorona TaxID=994334 RepID=A0A433CZQ7_9FUNG|nr:hypothetical protein BC936DRAFT_149979 [Jimgerdemannia flammicorona]